MVGANFKFLLNKLITRHEAKRMVILNGKNRRRKGMVKRKGRRGSQRSTVSIPRHAHPRLGKGSRVKMKRST